MMNSVDRVFSALRDRGQKAFIPYIMAGDPSPDRTKETVLMLEQCGADIVELGVPFTDPLADGATIQRAAERALKAGVTLTGVLALVRELRAITKIPLVLMTYYNPLFRYGEEDFVKDAVECGVSGVIIPDLPPDEAGPLIKRSREAGLATIFLLAPTSTETRIKTVTRACSGFIYYVSMTGITGAHLSIDTELRESIQTVRRISSKPVAIGFGVSSVEEAHALSSFADGVIVGSAIVKRLHEAPETLEAFVRGLREAINDGHMKGEE